MMTHIPLFVLAVVVWFVMAAVASFGITKVFLHVPHPMPEDIYAQFAADFYAHKADEWGVSRPVAKRRVLAMGYTNGEKNERMQ